MKKNLIVLLLVPFVIALLGVVTITSTFNFVDSDIVSISWKYDDVEGFKLSTNNYLLEAVGINQRKTAATTNTKLVWSVENKDYLDTEEHAEIVNENDKYYLKTLSVGEVKITCSNVKGNVTRSMTGVVYENGAILVSEKIKSSGNNVDSTIYYGDTDLVNGKMQDASFELQIKTLPAEMISELEVKEVSKNITFDKSSNLVKLSREASSGPAYIKFGFGDESVAKDTTFNFSIVRNGINCYTYDDLMYCTNKSQTGEIVVLRKSFESFDNAYQYDANGDLILEKGQPILVDNNVECFGKYNVSTHTFDFSKDVYRYKTTYNSNFIKQWNEHLDKNNTDSIISDELVCGLHIQKDFYGNGYTINLHNLTYPSEVLEIAQTDGTIMYYPTLAEKDLFRGPLPFYTLGDHNTMPLVEALGQDNAGLYVEGSNITLNDVVVKNCDFGGLVETLNTVGSVCDIYGENITIKNSRMSNGKNVIRSFSSKNVHVDNSMLSYAKNFLIFTGANEYITINEQIQNSYTTTEGNELRGKLPDYLKIASDGDTLLNNYLTANFTNKEVMRDALTKMQSALNNASRVPEDYAGTLFINDTLFYNSNVASIGVETLFNGPFLYCGSPSAITDLMDMFFNAMGIDTFISKNISGISYPVYVEVTGNTKFYNYQTIDKDHSTVDGIDVSGLINENITTMAASLGEQYAVDVNIDKFFPIKDYLYNKCNPNGEVYFDNGQAYMNIPVAFYGGGINNSVVNLDSVDCIKEIGKERPIDLMDAYLDLNEGTGTIGQYKNMLLKAVTVVTGFEPFKFRCMKNNGYLYGEAPQVKELIENARRVEK